MRKNWKDNLFNANHRNFTIRTYGFSSAESIEVGLLIKDGERIQKNKCLNCNPKGYEQPDKDDCLTCWGRGILN